jgi:hypothetical protein
MAEGKKSCLFYADWGDTFDELSDEDAGKLIKHFCDYIRDKNPNTDSVLIKAVFANMKSTLKRDLLKWGSIKQKRSDAGKKGGLAKQANARSVKQKLANQAVSVNDNVSVNVKDTVIVNKEVNEICNFAWSLFPKGIRPEKEEVSKMKLWSDTIDKLIRIDNKDPTEIKAVITWAREDEFWKSNFLSIVKLRTKKDGIKYYDIFNENRKNGRQRTEIDTKTISKFDPDSYAGFKGSNASDAESTKRS